MTIDIYRSDKATAVVTGNIERGASTENGPTLARIDLVIDFSRATKAQAFVIVADDALVGLHAQLLVTNGPSPHFMAVLTGAEFNKALDAKQQQDIEIVPQLNELVFQDSWNYLAPIGEETPEYHYPMASERSGEEGEYYAPIAHLVPPSIGGSDWSFRPEAQSELELFQYDTENKCLIPVRNSELGARKSYVLARKCTRSKLEKSLNAPKSCKLNFSLTPNGDTAPEPGGYFCRKLPATFELKKADNFSPIANEKYRVVRLSANDETSAETSAETSKGRYFLFTGHEIAANSLHEASVLLSLAAIKAKPDPSWNAHVDFCSAKGPKAPDMYCKIGDGLNTVVDEQKEIPLDPARRDQRVALSYEDSAPVRIIHIFVDMQFDRRLVVDFGSLHHVMTIVGKKDVLPLKTPFASRENLSGKYEATAERVKREAAAGRGKVKENIQINTLLKPTRALMRDMLGKKTLHCETVAPSKGSNLDADGGEAVIQHLITDIKSRFWRGEDKRDPNVMGNMADSMVDFLTAGLLFNADDAEIGPMLAENLQGLQVVATHPSACSQQRLMEFRDCLNAAARAAFMALQYNKNGSADARDETQHFSMAMTVPEPLASMAYSWKDSGITPNCQYLVLDFGHRTLDVALADPRQTEDGAAIRPNLLRSYGYPVGGQTVDYFLLAAMAEHLKAKLRADFKTDLMAAFPTSNQSLTLSSLGANDLDVQNIIPKSSEHGKARMQSILRRFGDAKIDMKGDNLTFQMQADATMATDKHPLKKEYSVFSESFAGIYLARILQSGKFTCEIGELYKTEAFRAFEEVFSDILQRIADQTAKPSSGKKVRVIITGRAARLPKVMDIIEKAFDGRDGFVIDAAARERVLTKVDHDKPDPAKTCVAEGAAYFAQKADLSEENPQTPDIYLLTRTNDGFYEARKLETGKPIEIGGAQFKVIPGSPDLAGLMDSINSFSNIYRTALVEMALPLAAEVSRDWVEPSSQKQFVVDINANTDRATLDVNLSNDDETHTFILPFGGVVTVPIH